MRKSIFMVLIVGVIPLSGCRSSSQERIESLKAGIATVQKTQAQIDIEIAGWQQFLAEGEKKMADPNNGPVLRQMAQDMATARMKLEALQALKQKAEAALVEFQKALAAVPEDPNLADEVNMWGTMLITAGGSIPAPIGGYLALGGWLLTTVAGGLKLKNQSATLKTNTAKLNQTETALTEVVQGGEGTKAGIQAITPEVVQLPDELKATVPGALLRAVVEQVKELAVSAFKEAQKAAQQTPTTTPIVEDLRAKAV